MHILIKIVIGLLAVIVLLLIVAFFVKKDYTVERSLVINKPHQQVYDYLKFIKNQDQYSKWVMTDPTMKKTFTGTDGTVGFNYAWDGNDKAGQGDQVITKLVDGQQVDTEIHFIRPFAGTAWGTMLTKEMPNGQTEVVWRMKGKNNYPVNLMNLFIGDMLGKDIDVSLNNLKTIIEK
ncbi:MAG: polyketide cyclase [Pedobacter sp.]|nr:MAG: polyketide cyclase [Pedobacter sp.]